MPVVNTINRSMTDMVYTYVPPMRGIEWSPTGLKRLEERRRDYAQQVEPLVRLQKELGQEGDRVGAREVKDLVRFWQQREKAATIAINHINAPVGPNEAWDMPADLSPFMDDEFHSYEAVRRFGVEHG